MTLSSRLLTLTLASTLSFGAVNIASAHDTPDGFVELTKRLSPAVVNISTSQNVDIKDDIPFYPEGSPLERFNDFFGGGNNGNSVSKSLGSGFVIDKTGYIVTNNHVIEGADLIEVNFPNGDNYAADLIGRDPATDIALLKIDAGKDMPFVNFGVSSDVEVGEWVIAIGNPFGYNGSVAAGIVSARNRNIEHGSYDDFIQTDVAINKGNSGGPLFNMAGEVVGVNTAILSPTGGSVGISFSIPADLADSVVGQLREFGETRRGRLGIRVQEVSAELAESYGLNDAHGALVRTVVAGSPADKAGLQRGDLIVELAGERLPESRILNRKIAEAAIGKELAITFIRKGKRKTVEATIERLEEEVTNEEKARKKKDAAEAERKVGGIAVEALTKEVRTNNRIGKSTQGVRVTAVDKNSRAAGKILPGDIIEEVGFEAVETPEKFETEMEAASELETAVQMLINRGGNYVFYAFKIG